MSLTKIQISKFVKCTIASKINVTPKGVYLPISKLHLSIITNGQVNAFGPGTIYFAVGGTIDSKLPFTPKRLQIF